MRLSLGAARVALAAIVAGACGSACYGAGGGTAPPPSAFYFPTGLSVSAGGNVLYAINSDFDLQWSGGTLQSYELFRIRHDAAQLVRANTENGRRPVDVDGHSIPFLNGFIWKQSCLVAGPMPGSGGPPSPSSNGQGVQLGEACAPPVDSTKYVCDSVVTGAFATDLQLSQNAQRLFAPVGGNATVTWADVQWDDPTVPLLSCPAPWKGPPSTSPFLIDCGTRVDGRCDGAHQAGDDPNSANNKRNVTMPGEPFGLAQTQDGTAMAVTSETDTKTSLLLTGLNAPPPSNPSNPPPANAPPPGPAGPPSMQFVLDGLPTGGVGIAAIPHDPLAVTRCEDVGDQPPCVRPAFLETTRNAAEVDLLRYYDDGPAGYAVHRPFLQKEAAFPITVNSIGTDSRGIVIDPTPRLQCEAMVTANGETGATAAADNRACAQLPARVFIANRTPATLLVGTVGQVLPDGTYDPDLLVLDGNVPLTDGPSKVYLAPIVRGGQYELRLFVLCYDTNSIFVYDPADLTNPTAAPEIIIPTGPGPFALTFDPFSLEQVVTDIATGTPVPQDTRVMDLTLNRYRFAYVASFRDSFLQVIDLDQSNLLTYGSVVFTLGQPTPPKGS
jgi:hypothetical protein